MGKLVEDKEKIVKFIDENLDVVETEWEVNENFNQLKEFLNRSGVSLTLELALELVSENEILNSMISFFVEEYGHFSKLLVDENGDCFIEAYCLLNDIDIQKDVLDASLNYYSDNVLNTYLHNLPKTMTAEEETEFLRKIHEGDDEAKRIFIERNLRFVVTIAKRFRGRGLELIDLIEEGNIGFMKAVEKFDIDKGYKFLTYAKWWIRQKISRAIREKSREIRIPSSMYEELSLYQKAIKKLRNEYHREPSLESIAQELGVLLETVKEYYQMNQVVLRLDDTLSGSDDDQTEKLQDFVQAQVDKPDDVAICSMLRNSLLTLAQDILTEKELQVLLLKYGFYNGREYSYREIEKIMGCSNTTIQAIHRDILRKLREHVDIDGFIYYLDNPDKANFNLTYYRSVYKQAKSNSSLRYKNILLPDETISEGKKKYLERPRKHKIPESLDMYFSKGCSEDMRNDIIRQLDDKYLTILKKAFGENLDLPLNTENWTVNDRDCFRKTIRKMLMKKSEEAVERQKYGNFAKEEYQKLWSILNGECLDDLLGFLSPVAAVVICFHVNKISANDIAHILDMKLEEVELVLEEGMAISLCSEYISSNYPAKQKRKKR